MTDMSERTIAGMLMVGFHDIDSPELADLISRGVRNFVLFRRNALTRAQVLETTRRLREMAGDDAIIAIDHEGGAVNRLRGIAPDWPSQMAVAAVGDLDLARRAAFASASQLRDLGINLNFAPVADLATDHHNPVVGTRAFSDDPVIAADFVRAAVAGHREAGVAAAAKHFPGHGATPVDSHLDLPTITRTRTELEECDLLPFLAAADDGVDCFMTSHIWYTGLDAEKVPATLSTSVVDLARTGVGFDGVIVTDCLEMGAIQEQMSTPEAVVRAALAGSDMLLVSHQHHLQREALDALSAALSSSRLPGERVEAAAGRIEELRSRITRGTAEESPSGASIAEELAARAVTVVRDEGVLPLRIAPGETLALVTFPLTAATLAETIEGSAFLEAVISRCPGVDVIAVTDEPDAVETAHRALENADHVIVATSFATGRPVQGELVRRLADQRHDFVVVATRDPFDLLQFPQAPCYIATHGDIEASAREVLAVVLDGAAASGRIPVALPGLYPRGHGLVTAG
jgi:beta-N-acetylhexosaminidase